jgi:hypothetical protein
MSSTWPGARRPLSRIACSKVLPCERLHHDPMPSVLKGKAIDTNNARVADPRCRPGLATDMCTGGLAVTDDPRQG